MIQHIPNRLQHVLSILQHLMIPKPQHLYSLIGQVLSASTVLTTCLCRVVLPAIQFDGQTLLVTVEIQHIRFHRVLPTKFAAGKTTVAEQSPH